MSIDPYRSGDPAAAEREDRARMRFFAIGLVRLGGAFIVFFGIVMMLQRLSWVQGATARYAGFALSVVGLFVFAILTRLMARRWASPREP
jgi:cell division protein FtsW (lipid II flippase)